tara:strand:- start:2547 stop:4244 length:1698 start_codon:yes stop_codon:yes gene_type:complete
MALKKVNGNWYDEDMSPEDIAMAEANNRRRLQQGVDGSNMTRGAWAERDLVDPWSKIDADDNWLQKLGKTAADWTIAPAIRTGVNIGDEIEDTLGNADGVEKNWDGDDASDLVFTTPGAGWAGAIGKGAGKALKSRKFGPLLEGIGFGGKGFRGLKPDTKGFVGGSKDFLWNRVLPTAAMGGLAYDALSDDGGAPANATIDDPQKTSDTNAESDKILQELLGAEGAEKVKQALAGEAPSLDNLDPNIDQLNRWKTARDFLGGGMKDHANYAPDLFANDNASGIDPSMFHAIQGNVDTHQLRKYAQKLNDLENRANVVKSHQSLIDEAGGKDWSEHDKMAWVQKYNRGELDDFATTPPSMDNPTPSSPGSPSVSNPGSRAEESLNRADDKEYHNNEGTDWFPNDGLWMAPAALAAWALTKGKAKPPKMPRAPQGGGTRSLEKIKPEVTHADAIPMSMPQWNNRARRQNWPKLENQAPRLGNRQPGLDNARPNFETVGGPRNVTSDVINVPSTPPTPRLTHTPPPEPKVIFKGSPKGPGPVMPNTLDPRRYHLDGSLAAPIPPWPLG